MRTEPLRAATCVGLAVPALALAVTVVFPATSAHAAPAILLAGLVAGVPHGAFDHRVAAWSGTDRSRDEGPGGVVARYLLWTPLVLAALLVFPAPALGVLVAVSVAHFAEGEAAFAARRDGRRRDRLDAGAGWVVGLAMVAAPVLAHPAASAHLVGLVTGWHPTLPPAPARDALLAGLLAGAAVVAFTLWRVGRRVQCVEVALVVLIGMLASPGVAFGVTFAAVHSAHHLGRLADLRSRSVRAPGAGASLTGSLLPLAVTVAGGVAFWSVGSAPAARVVLSAVLALTIPHAVIVATAMDGRRRPHRPVGRMVAPPR